MTLQDLIDRLTRQRAGKLAERAAITADLAGIRAALTDDDTRELTAAEQVRITTGLATRSTLDDQITDMDRQLDTWRREQVEDERVNALAREYHPTYSSQQRAASGVPDGLYRVDQVGGQGASRGGDRPGARWTRQDGRPAVVERSQRFGDHPIVAEYVDRRAMAERAVIEGHGSLGNLVRSMSTTSGSAIVPTVWSADIIDRARNISAVISAGAEIVPMTAKTVQIGRLAADPSSAFRTEGSLIAASDPTFDNVTLTANTLSCLVTGSMEWWQDAENVDEVVSNAIAKSVATELDLNALYGGIIAGSEVGPTGFNPPRTLPSPPSPRGVLAALLAVAPGNVLGGAVNGTTQTATTPFNEIIDTIYTPADSNETVNGLLWSSRMARRYNEQYDTTNQPLRMPDALASIPRYMTNQIPSNMTVGTSVTNMSDVFAGDWTQLLIGQRLDFQIQILQERYAELGSIGIVATWRGDIQPARPRAFACYRYLKNT